MDINKIESISDIVAYNNQTTLKRLALSPSWTLGLAAGLICGGYKESRKTSEKHNSPANTQLATNATSGYISSADIILNVLFAKSAVASTLWTANTWYMGTGIVLDACCLSDGQFMGAMKTGFKQGRLGGYIDEAKYNIS